MKKLLTLLIPVMMFFSITGIVYASVWQYGSYQERAEMAAMCGIFGYKGTAKQNLSKEVQDCFKSFNGELLGFSVITRYRTTISSSMTSSQSTIPVSSMKTFDGDTITMAMLGSKVYLTVEPGSIREEIIKCTGISGSNWTGCTRGLAFSGTSDASVSTNQKAHNAGSVVVMSNVHYVYDELIDRETNASTTGILGVSRLDIASSTDSTTQEIIFGTSTPGRIKFENGVAYYCNNGASCAAIGAGANTYSFIRPLYNPSGSNIGLATSTSDFVLDGSGNLSIRKNNSITSNADGLAIATTSNYTWTGNHTFNGDTTFSGNPTNTGTSTGFTLFGGQRALGDLSLTSGTTTNNTWATSTEYGTGTIDETAALAFGANFQNRVVHVKFKGDLTVNGNISVNGLGGSGAPTVTADSSGASGSDYVYGWDDLMATTTHSGTGGINGGDTGTGGGGGGGASAYTEGTAGAQGGANGGANGGAGGATGPVLRGYTYYYQTLNNRKVIEVSAGAGGASGGSGDTSDGIGGTGGAGGDGGGMIIIEVDGDLTLGANAVISARGNDGSAGGAAVKGGGTDDGGGGGGGGGAGGTIVILYSGTFTDNGATIDVSGGTGGTGGAPAGGAGTGGAGGSGGTGYSMIAKNYSF